MSTANQRLLISVPFGNGSTSVNSPRYFWDSSKRGDQQFVILQWTLEGLGSFTLEEKTWALSPGDVFVAIVPEQSSYCFPKQAAEPWRFAWLNFYGPVAISLIRQFRDNHGPVLPLALHSVAGGLFLRLAETAQLRAFPDSYEASSACFAFLMEWIRQLEHPATHDLDRVETAITLCRSRFREPLGIKELATATGLTREHLTRIFTARTGIPPGCYLRNLRVAAARQMIESHDVPLKEVALRCGFASVRSLSHALAGIAGSE